MTVPLDVRNDIRSMDADGVPRAEIAKRLRVSRNTVAKYADMEDMPPEPPLPERRRRPALEGHEAWVESVLEADLEAERASRESSKRATLLRRCALPAPKTFDGYDWSAVSWPEGMGREDLLSLGFLGRREDLVLMGDVGTGKTHMASALCALACERRLEARFFTASALVSRLRRARDEGRLDREAAQIGRARLLVIDELGFLPLDADGARLVFQVFADAYETQSVVITTNLEFSRWGSVFGDDQMAAAVIDRIVHHGRLVQFRGESYRVRHALMQEG